MLLNKMLPAVIRIAVVMLALVGCLSAQTKVRLNPQSQTPDFRTFAATFPASVGASLPLTCAVGQLYFLTTATAGQNIYVCASTNIWTAVTSSGGGGGGTPGGVSGSVQINTAGAFAGVVLGNAQILVGQTSGGPLSLPVSGDCTITATGNITCLKTNNITFAPSATTDTTNASNITSGTLSALRGGMTYPGAGIPNSTGTAWGTSYSLQGNGTKVQMAAGATTTGDYLKYDANGNAIDGGPGVGVNAIAIQSIPVIATPPITNQALVYNGTNYVPTTLTTIGSGLGASVTGGSSAVVNVNELSRSVSGGTDTLVNADCGGLVAYTGTGTTVALAQAGLGGNFLSGCPLAVANYGSGPVVVTASVSNILTPSSSNHILTVVAGLSAKIVSDGTNYKLEYQTTAGGSGGGGFPSDASFPSGNTSGGSVGTGILNPAPLITGGGGNGIKNALVSASTTQTTIWVPPSYASPVPPVAGEQTPMHYGNAAQLYNGDGNVNAGTVNLRGNITYCDLRFGFVCQFADNLGTAGSVSGSNYFTPMQIQSWQTTPFPVLGGLGNALDISDIALHGGANIQGPGSYANQTFHESLNIWLHRYTPSQGFALRLQTDDISVGDSYLLYGIGDCYGGVTTSTDEGCRGYDLQMHQGLLEYRGPVTAVSGNQVTVNAGVNVVSSTSAGQGTEGEGRYKIDIDSSVTYSTGTISAITGSGPNVFTGSGVTWPTSTETTTTAAITTPSATAQAIPVASIGSITTGTKLCLADNFKSEQVVVTSVPSGIPQGIVRYPHISGAIVAYGGLSCDFIKLDADTALASQFSTSNGQVFSLQNDLHWYFPIISSPTSSTIKVWIAYPGQWVDYRGRWANVSGQNTYSISPGAEIISIMQNQTVSGTATLEVAASALTSPNGSGTPFATSHNTLTPQYPVMNIGHALESSYQVFPRLPGGAPAQQYYNMSGMFVGNNLSLDTNTIDTFMRVDNTTPCNLFATNVNGSCVSGPAGVFEGPNLFDFRGVYERYFNIAYNAPGLGTLSAQSPNYFIEDYDTVNAWSLFLQHNPSGAYMSFNVNPTTGLLGIAGSTFINTIVFQPQNGEVSAHGSLTSGTASAAGCIAAFDGAGTAWYYVPATGTGVLTPTSTKPSNCNTPQ